MITSYQQAVYINESDKTSFPTGTIKWTEGWGRCQWRVVCTCSCLFYSELNMNIITLSTHKGDNVTPWFQKLNTETFCMPLSHSWYFITMISCISLPVWFSSVKLKRYRVLKLSVLLVMERHSRRQGHENSRVSVMQKMHATLRAGCIINMFNSVLRKLQTVKIKKA